MTIIDLTTLTSDELAQLQVDVEAEQGRRYAISTAPGRIAEENIRYLDAIGRVDGGQWAQPEGAHDAYPQAWVVEHNGKDWESLIPANVWEPGVSGWRELVAPEEGPAAWVQPSGAHDAYKKGDRVSHLGGVWISTTDGNIWAPGVYGWTAQ